MDDLISGMEDDLYTNRYQTFEELYSYCYRVASTVGLVCIDIYGVESTAAEREFAEAWGIAMQLTNILRDVQEDAERDRIYLPLEDLHLFSVLPLHHLIVGNIHLISLRSYRVFLTHD